uniref:Choline/carnitine acyltransferase domain-containing protein n=1 Tax=Globisporangium ultimum (strain ATCC 200006 / CBS 805.95 / DAOM BR144) TaxID=431595 RepID=K3X4S1_GLOUD
MAQANGTDARNDAATDNGTSAAHATAGAPAPVDPADTLTYRHQRSLPKLPIPTLEETCARYLEYIYALQTPEEYEESKKSVAEFLKKDGPALQQKLIEYDQDKNSYIEDFWYEAYLNHRSSVVLNVNPFFVLEDDPTPSRNNQISRAASLVLGSLKFINALRKGTLEPDMWRNNMALCMNQYKRLFGCARMPTAHLDEAFVDDKSKHIVVMCRNQFYWFDVIWEDGVTAITERELVNNLKAIKENAMQATDVEAASQAIGVLTTEHRATWAKLRQKLIVKNAESLAVIDRALFLVCLDNTTPPDGAAFASTALHGTYGIVNGVQIGTCMNRWYDKLQIIVCENGVAGVNFEHSFVDGHTVLRFVSDVYTDTIIRFAQTIRGGSYSFLEASYRAPQLSESADKPRVTPRKLEWSLDVEIEEGIKFAESKLSDLILQNEVDVLEFTSFGKLFITQHKMSPDAFVQMAFIAAYYFQYGSAPNVYEPVLTKRFLHGRTEAARSMTKEALEFLDIFFTEKSPIDKIESLKNAINAQVKVVRNCASGKGVERHLFALECLWQADQRANSLTGQTQSAPKPAIFGDIGWKKLNHTILSTSNCGNPSLRLFGFGPVSPDGFGIGYIIKDEGIQFCASSKHRQTARYLKNLEAYLLRVQDLLLQEEEIRFPNTKRTSKSLSSAFKGYGFFDSGSTAPAKNSSDISIARVGRPLE